MVNMKVKGGISNLDEKAVSSKPKKSFFHLSISTNQKYEPNDKHLENDSKIFDDCINDILHNIKDYVKLPEDHKWDDDHITDAEASYVVEVGKQEKGKRLHCHILFKFVHRSKIHLDYDKIKQRIIDRLGIKNVYMLNRLVRPTDDMNVISYLNKYGK